jgi:formate/nitrite transporter
MSMLESGFQAAEPRSAAPVMATVDNYSPSEIARLVDERGATKANASAMTTLALAVLAGAFIGLGGVFATLIGTGSNLGFGPTRMLMGLGFSLGLVLVIIAGAELFTGNNLIVMSWVSNRISLTQLVRNWTLVYFGNLVGAVSVAGMVYLAGWWQQAETGVGVTALAVANQKVNLSFTAALARGILANALVCLAVWLASSARSLSDKIFAIIFPITAFVASGFEHSIANMYFIPLGMLLAGDGELVQAARLSGQLDNLTVAGFGSNLLASTIGNVIGGGVLVGLVYWFIYMRQAAGREKKR